MNANSNRWGRGVTAVVVALFLAGACSSTNPTPVPAAPTATPEPIVQAYRDAFDKMVKDKTFIAEAPVEFIAAREPFWRPDHPVSL